jgi:predicted TIM-barrel fold metal-dependent hydrolase
VEQAFEACDQYPDRFIKFCNVDPRVEAHTAEYDFVAVLEYYRSLGACGVGEVTAPLGWHEPRVRQLLGACEKVGMPFLFHLGVRADQSYGLVCSAGLGELEQALQAYPNLQFLAHSQTWWAEVGPNPTLAERAGYPAGPVLPGGRVPELMRRYRNLWGDLSAGSGCNAVKRDPAWGCTFMEEFQDRLLMGLDICTPANDKCQLLGVLRDAVTAAKISETAYRKIMGRNAEELLHLS